MKASRRIEFLLVAFGCTLPMSNSVLGDDWYKQYVPRIPTPTVPRIPIGGGSGPGFSGNPGRTNNGNRITPQPNPGRQFGPDTSPSRNQFGPDTSIPRPVIRKPFPQPSSVTRTPASAPTFSPQPPTNGNLFGNAMSGVLNGIGNRPQSQPGSSHFEPARPTYYPQSQSQSYVQPVVNTIRTSSPPPRNTVVVAKKPVTNARLGLHDEDFDRISAETAAYQNAEAAKAGGKLDAGIQNSIQSSSLSEPDKTKTNEAWADAVLSGDPKKYEEFKKNFGGNLTPQAQEWLDTRIALLNYGKELESGLLTGAQMDDRLQNLHSMIDGMGPSVLKEGIQSNLTQMDKYNDLGKLATLVQGTANSFQVLCEGCQNAGLSSAEMSDVMGMPIMLEVAETDSKVALADILLANPEENGQAVGYNLGSHVFTMKPGEKQPLTQSYVLSLDPGNGTTPKQYTLDSGVYEFDLHGSAWDLSKVTPKVTIDNTRYKGKFAYTVNGQEASLAPGQVVEHTDSSAIVIEFDRGDGSTPARKVLTTGTFVVGIDPAKQCLDLYDAKEEPRSTFIAGGSGIGNSAVSAGSKKSRQQQIEEALARLKARGS